MAGARIVVIPVSLFEAAAFRELSAVEMRVLLCLWSYRNRKTEISRPGMRVVLSRAFGMQGDPSAPDFYDRRNPRHRSTYRSFMRAIDGLKQKGFVRQLNRTGYRIAAEYKLAENDLDLQRFKGAACVTSETIQDRAEVCDS